MNERFGNAMHSSLALALAAALLALASPGLASAQWIVHTELPEERRAEMLAALRLELAGRATVLEPAPAHAFEPETTVSAMRRSASEFGATHALWISFPSGLLAPAEVRVLDLSRADAAHGMTPQAWDVVDPRVVAVLAGSLMEAASEGPLPVATREPPAVVPPPTVVAAVSAESTEAVGVPDELPDGEVLAAPPGPPPFSIGVALGFSHRSAPGTSLRTSGLSTIHFYRRLTEWASVGLRLQIGDLGYSSIEGAIISGAIGAPSLLVSFREGLDPLLTLELGVHTEGGLFFYGRNLSEWSFGLGVGAVANLDIGPHHSISLDYTLSMFGFGDAGAHSWGAASLGYVYRWE